MLWTLTTNIDLIIIVVQNGAILRLFQRDIATIMTLVRDGRGTLAGTDARSNHKYPALRVNSVYNDNKTRTHQMERTGMRHEPASWNDMYWHCGDKGTSQICCSGSAENNK